MGKSWASKVAMAFKVKDPARGRYYRIGTLLLHESSNQQTLNKSHLYDFNFEQLHSCVYSRRLYQRFSAALGRFYLNFSIVSTIHLVDIHKNGSVGEDLET